MKEYMTHAFKNHKIISTEDGSNTLYSEKYDENCHSLSGARAETIFQYIEGCHILDRAPKEELTILEVGLGTGLGVITTIEELLKLPSYKPVHLVSLEESTELIEYFKHQIESSLCDILNSKEVKIESESNPLFDHISIPDLNIKITLIKGDARKSLPEYLKQNPIKFKSIYQDAFSPKKNPILWTVEWFQLLFHASDESCRLSTYSSSISVQKSMMEAGWKIHNGGAFGKKRSSTRAIKTGTSSPDLVLKLEQSNVSTLLDKDISIE